MFESENGTINYPYTARETTELQPNLLNKALLSKQTAPPFRQVSHD
jgi:hypothetical protein